MEFNIMKGRSIAVTESISIGLERRETFCSLQEVSAECYCITIWYNIPEIKIPCIFSSSRVNSPVQIKRQSKLLTRKQWILQRVLVLMKYRMFKITGMNRHEFWGETKFGYKMATSSCSVVKLKRLHHHNCNSIEIGMSLHFFQVHQHLVA